MDNAALEAIEKLIIALGYKVRNVALGSASVPAKDGTVSSKQVGIFTVVDGTAKVDDDTATTALTAEVTGYDMYSIAYFARRQENIFVIKTVIDKTRYGTVRFLLVFW